MEPSQKSNKNAVLSSLNYLISSLPSIGNVTGTSLMLVICAITVGSLYPELRSDVAGPAVYNFLTGIGINLFSGVIERLRAKKEKNETLTRQDIEMILAVIKETKLEEQLENESFQREVRNQFARLDLIPYLIMSGQQNTSKLIIQALNSKLDLLSLSVVKSIDQQTTQINQITEDINKLVGAVTELQGKRTTARISSPPGKHIFISYSHRDGNDFARRLYDHLEAEGADVWLDLFNIQPGDEWDSTIQTAIEDCRLFLFIITPESVQSKVCANEWSHAISTHKAIIPLLWKDASIPLRLNRLQYIDFRPEFTKFEQGLAKLRISISAMEQPRLSQDRILEQQESASVKIEQENKASRPRDRVFRNTKIINPLPQSPLDERFKNRNTERARIVNWFIAGVPFVGIYGRGGIGKTALACKVLRDFINSPNQNSINGIVNLNSVSGGSTDISVERIFSDLQKLLNDEKKEIAVTTWRDAQSSIDKRISNLLQLFQDGNYLLFLDNLETLQDPITHRLIDTDLERLLEIIIEHDSSLHILVTSRLPLKLSNTIASKEKRISLSSGLPKDEAITLLRDLDEDGEAKLSEIPDEKLTLLVNKTSGFPRALEAAVGFLKNSSITGLDELLENNIIFSNEVTQVIVQQAILRLPPNSLMVMEGLSVFGRPVTEGAIEFLIAPYMDTSQLPDILESLTNSYFVSYNKATKYFSLHPIDQEYCYNRIPPGTLDDISKAQPIYSRYVLHFRAAESYKLQHKPKDQLHDFNDITPILYEYEHRMFCEDYDGAAGILLEIEYDFLHVEGYYSLLVKMMESLKNKVKNPLYEMGCHHSLARSYYSLGKMQQSIVEDSIALKIAIAVNDLVMQATCYGGIGFSHQASGKPRIAISYFEKALKTLPPGQDEVQKSWYLNGMGLSYLDLGQYETAYQYYHQGYLNSPSSRDGKVVAATCLGNAAEVLTFLSRFKEAKKYSIDALKIAREINEVSGLSFYNYCLALSEFYDNPPHLDAARTAAENASKYNEPVENHSVWALLGAILLRQGDQAQACKAFIKSIEWAEILLKEDPENCNVLDSKGVALCGLAFCGNYNTLPLAKDILEKSRKASNEKGIADQTLRLINAIAQVDTEGKLSEIKTMMAQYL